MCTIMLHEFHCAEGLCNFGFNFVFKSNSDAMKFFFTILNCEAQPSLLVVYYVTFNAPKLLLAVPNWKVSCLSSHPEISIFSYENLMILLCAIKLR